MAVPFSLGTHSSRKLAGAGRLNGSREEDEEAELSLGFKSSHM